MSKMCLRRQKFLIPSNCILLSLVFLIKLLYYRYVYISLLIHFFLSCSHSLFIIFQCCLKFAWSKKKLWKEFWKVLEQPSSFSFSLGDWISFTKRKLQKKFPENNLYSLYFKTYLNTVNTYFYTGLHISCPKKSPSH